MKRRPFLKSLTALGGTLSLGSFAKLSAEEFKKDSSEFKTVYKFATASDGHFGQPDTDFMSSHTNLITALHQESNLDFVVFNGDLIHDNPIFMPQVKQVYDRLRVPYYVSKGNHDRVSDEEWKFIWGSEPNSFQIFDNQYGIVLLNCSNVAGDYLCADMDFAIKTLDSLFMLQHVFVFIHISQNDWTRHGVACEDFLKQIADYSNIKAVFHGHDHDVDGVMWNRKKPYFWSGHFGGNWGNPFPSYRVVEIDEMGVVRTALKRVSDGEILNAHRI